jgi:hypothetical protein
MIELKGRNNAWEMALRKKLGEGRKWSFLGTVSRNLSFWRNPRIVDCKLK